MLPTSGGAGCDPLALWLKTLLAHHMCCKSLMPSLLLVCVQSVESGSMVAAELGPSPGEASAMFAQP